MIKIMHNFRKNVILKQSCNVINGVYMTNENDDNSVNNDQVYVSTALIDII